MWPSCVSSIQRQCKAVSELVATASATAVAKGVAKDILYLNAWWPGNLAVAAKTRPV